jgi:glutaredoxin 3
VTLELYGTTGCPYTRELREWLELRGAEVTEYDVETDAGARARMWGLTSAPRMVPVLVENGKVKQVGWQGRGCVVAE